MMGIDNETDQTEIGESAIPVFALDAALSIGLELEGCVLAELLSGMIQYESNGDIPKPGTCAVVRGFVAIYAAFRDAEKQLDEIYK